MDKFDWELKLPKRLEMTGQPNQESGGGGGLIFPRELDEGYPSAKDAKAILEELGAVPGTLSEAYELCAKLLEVGVSTLQNNWRQVYLQPIGLHTVPWEVAVLLVDLGEQDRTPTARKAWMSQGWPAEIVKWRETKNQSQPPSAGAIVLVEDTIPEMELSPRQEAMMARILDSNTTTALTPDQKLMYQLLGQQQAFEAAAVTNAAFRTTQSAIADMQEQVLRERVRDITSDRA